MFYVNYHLFTMIFITMLCYCAGYRDWDAVQAVCVWSEQPSERAGEGEAQNPCPHSQAHLSRRHCAKRGWFTFRDTLKWKAIIYYRELALLVCTVK